MWYLNPIVGRENVNLNFDVDKIPKFIPKFYELCLTEFSKFVRKSPVTKVEILNQPVWNKAYIKHHKQSFYIRELYNSGIKSVGDIWSVAHNKIKPLSSFIDVNSLLYWKLFLSWFFLTKSFPSEWTSVLKNESHLLNVETDKDRDMNEVTDFKKLSSHFVYNMLCQNECVLSKGKIRFTNLTDNKSSWQNICNLIYSVSIDTKVFSI